MKSWFPKIIFLPNDSMKRNFFNMEFDRARENRCIKCAHS